MTRSLVTGGSGYFGSLLVRRLLDAGHDVRVLDLNDADDRPAEVQFVAGDIRDRAAVEAAVEHAGHVLLVDRAKEGAQGFDPISADR